MFSVEPLVITGEERIELERRARAHTSTQREARRARVILLCADGMALRQIGLEVGMDQHQVCGVAGSSNTASTGWRTCLARVAPVASVTMNA